MTRTYQMTQRRQAFTLVEMLVAMALIGCIMVILSEAFIKGLESFRQLKAIGDMEEKLRTASTILRRDLSADHFEGRRRLSDGTFWIQGIPREGFVRIYQGAESLYEGEDTDGNPSLRAPKALGPAGNREVHTHRLHFTVKLRGNRQDDFFSAKIEVPNPPSPLFNATTNFFNQAPDGRFQDLQAPTTYNSPWAEVAYFLEFKNEYAGATPLFSLYRSQVVVVPDNRQLNWSNVMDTEDPNNYLEMCFLSRKSKKFFFFNPSDLAKPTDGATPSNPTRALNPLNPNDRNAAK